MLLDALHSLEQATGAKRSESDDGDDLRADRYVSKLRDYPGDIALFVLATWDDEHEFFPRWKELKIALDAKFEWRRKLLPALQACVPFDRIAEAEPPPSEEDIAEVRARTANTVAMLKETTRKMSQGYAALKSPRPRSDAMRLRFET